jgi:hypothetical protein
VVEKKNPFSKLAQRQNICRPMVDYILQSEALHKPQFIILMVGEGINISVDNLPLEEQHPQDARWATSLQGRLAGAE